MSDKVRYGFDVSAAIPKDIQPADLIVNGVEYWPVVRCKDCKRGKWKVSGLDNKTKGYRCAIHAVLGVDFGDNGYCSYGERKEK